MKSWNKDKVECFIDDNNTQFNKIDDPDYDYELVEGIVPKSDGSNVDCCTIEQMENWGIEMTVKG